MIVLTSVRYHHKIMAKSSVFPPSVRLHRHFRGLRVVLQGPMPWTFPDGLAEADDVAATAALGGYATETAGGFPNKAHLIGPY